MGHLLPGLVKMSSKSIIKDLRAWIELSVFKFYITVSLFYHFTFEKISPVNLFCYDLI